MKYLGPLVRLHHIDDIGLLPASADAAEGFYSVVEASYEKRSLAIISNVSESGSSFPNDLTLAAIELDGRFAPSTGFVRTEVFGVHPDSAEDVMSPYPVRSMKS